MGQGRHTSLFTRLAPLLGAVLLVAACTTPAAIPLPGQSAGGPVAAPAPKTLVMGVQAEPVTIVAYGRTGEGGTTSSRYERYHLFHANLTMFDVGVSGRRSIAT